MPSRPARRAVLGGAAGLLGVGLLGCSRSSAEPVPGPEVIGTQAWGAQEPRRRARLVGPPRTVLIHHTASANVADTSRQSAYDIARQIQRWHLANGWGDTGQHFTVSRGGFLLEGRHGTLDAVRARDGEFPFGAHSASQNRTALGIETQGTFTAALPTSAQWGALVSLCTWLCRSYDLAADAIDGHRDYEQTACPGDALFARLPDLRDAVDRELGRTPSPATTRR
ncbi:peptidoglycan recognition protein family protein [Barrientosiimonas endolithica]|uniref:N-acetylmuramoyl-L-alanine amidase n=1 Tax=Barrientosiimonas endolithica TaxID=1535208 RepID=A0ABN6YGX2_9MICO|nr:peptidoglycan recognition family protein [Barrientosiimonas endolithica]BDZ56682.1 hypothetical protein GCM10025872_03390 [Barrientosiimonas endolithica]